MPRGGVAAVLVLGARVESAVGKGPGALVAVYGALREEPSSRGRTRQLGDLIVTLLRESGIEAMVRDQEPLVVMFRHEGRPHLMNVSWAGEANGWSGEELVATVSPSALASMSALAAFATVSCFTECGPRLTKAGPIRGGCLTEPGPSPQLRTRFDETRGSGPPKSCRRRGRCTAQFPVARLVMGC